MAGLLEMITLGRFNYDLFGNLQFPRAFPKSIPKSGLFAGTKMGIPGDGFTSKALQQFLARIPGRGR
jgi:hypothetical protein